MDMPVLKFTAAQPEVADWSESVQVPSVPMQKLPTEDWSGQSATEDVAAPTKWVRASTERS